MNYKNSHGISCGSVQMTSNWTVIFYAMDNLILVIQSIFSRMGNIQMKCIKFFFIFTMTNAQNAFHLPSAFLSEEKIY